MLQLALAGMMSDLSNVLKLDMVPGAEFAAAAQCMHLGLAVCMTVGQVRRGWGCTLSCATGRSASR